MDGIFLMFCMMVLLGIVICTIPFKKGKKKDSDRPDVPNRERGRAQTDLSFFAEDDRHRHTGRCDGNCAQCPPHYGYRYGRWYYGHDHIHGCEFGGNRGGGKMD